MHNEHVFPSGIVPFSLVPTPGRLKRLDQLSSESVNGDAGGTWNPAAPIIHGGAGVQIFSIGGTSGGLTTGKGAAAGGALILGDSDLPVLNPTGSKTTLIALCDYFNRRDRSTPGDAAGGIAFFPVDEPTPGTFVDNTAAKGTFLMGPIPSRRLLHNAVITSITLRMRLLAPPSAVDPGNLGMPGFRICRFPQSGVPLVATRELYNIPLWVAATVYNVGDVVVPASGYNGRQFRCTVAGTSGGAEPAAFTGAGSPGDLIVDNTVTWLREIGPSGALGHYCRLKRPASVEEYFANGNAQDITMTVGNGLKNTTIDLTQGYVFDVYDPTADVSGIPARIHHAFHSIKIVMSSIAALRPNY